MKYYSESDVGKVTIHRIQYVFRINMYYIVERFYRVKFQNMRYCLYNKQTHFLLLTLFDNLKRSIVSALISKINTCVKGHI